jgi:hypothetical protein
MYLLYQQVVLLYGAVLLLYVRLQVRKLCTYPLVYLPKRSKSTRRLHHPRLHLRRRRRLRLQHR